MDVSVIIVSYNSSDVLKSCLDSLSQADRVRVEVIVVDNASADGTPDFVRTNYPWVTMIAGDENLGYSKGVNIGIRRAAGRYFFILNPDTTVPPEAITKLITFMDRTRDAGIVGPKLVFHDGNTQLSCRRFYTFKVLLLRRTPLGKIFKNSKSVREHLMLDFDHNETREVDWLLGAAMFVRREAVENVGMMDERFFLYFEDVDWCYRMRQNGLKVYYRADAIVTHGYQRDSAQSVLNRSFVAHFVSLLRYYEKWNPLIYFVKRYREVAKVFTFLTVDLIAINAAFVCAYLTRTALGDVFTNPLFPMATYNRFVFFANLLFVFAYSAFGLYRIRRETLRVDELFDIGKAVVLASVILMTSTYLGQMRSYSRLVVAFMVPFAVLFDWGLRSGLRHLHRRVLALKVDLKRAIVVGPKNKARELEIEIVQDDSLGIDVVGVIDTAGQSDGILTGMLGGPQEIEKVIDRHRVQEVIVLPNALDEDSLSALVAMARRRIVDVTVLTNYSAMVFHEATVSELQGRPVISYRRNTRYTIDRVAKRATDILVGAVFAAVSLPFFVLYSIYALSRGRRPFTYSDRRGLEGKTFTIPIVGDDGADGPSDFINLPLFWLVVVGKLSMVGPYPLRPEDADQLSDAARIRYDVRPGVTGYWRAARRSTVTLDDVLVQDATYLRTWSPLQDLKIVTMTIGRMLWGRSRNLEIESSERGTR